MKLRMLKQNWDRFIEQLCLRADVETAGVILAERLAGGRGLLARELMLVPEDGYIIRSRDRIRIDPIALNRLIRPARDRGLSILTVHTHPGTIEPWFSAADDIGDAVLMPSLFAQTPGPHGSVVVAGGSRTPAARIWADPGTAASLIDTHLVGQSLGVFAATSEPGDGGWFDRQRLALGPHGQALVRRLHVGVVGAGGTGSITFAQLVHLGVGEITVVDGDSIDQSNLSRIFGARVGDPAEASKVDVAVRYAAVTGLGTKVSGIAGHLGHRVPISALEDCDVIFLCVDAHLARSLVNRLAYEKAIPIFDMGSAFRVGPDGRISGAAGRVVVAGPTRPCLACWGHIDSNRVRIECLPPKEKEDLAAEGYIEGADVAQPSVIAFNTLVAGAAVVEFLRLVTEFAGAHDPPLRLGFDFITGVARRNRLAERSGCSICQRFLVPVRH
jgi:hypothetical protein